MSWLTSGNRKRHQRRMNKIMRDFNLAIENDELWRGRYVVRQIASQWYSYEDKSGNELYTVIEFKDRMTGETWRQGNTVNHFAFGSRFFWLGNHFITERTSTWETNPKPNTSEYKTLTDKYLKEGWPY